MVKFHKLKVADIRRETADCVSVALEVPASLKEAYKFIQGQYLTLKFFVNGEEIRRSYSICSGIHENEMRVAVKKVQGGKGSNFINDNLKSGNEIEVMTPMGSFHSPMNTSHRKNYVLFAGGSGITPLLSILKTVLQTEPQSTLILFYGNLNEESTIFKKQLDELSQKNSARFNLHYIFDKPASPSEDIYKGIITKEKAKTLFDKHISPDADNEFFICGPKPMMDNVRETLEEKKIDQAIIHVEYFTSSIDAPDNPVSPSEKVIAQVTVVQYGKETTFELSSGGKAILDAAIDAGVDAPFACKGAVCATCRGKVLEGKVHMNKNFALTDTEVAEGFILTCQSHPITPVVKVDYDV
ncbi:MAG: 2Fe-2S iron-sulfur cluster binding domain-containing protein [Bacteroidetes bacterium]|nr:MAG: 2Fe-2S iron-sulfur cluster binding domain-containing protein [Bacteroidota bacterium]